MAVHDRERDCDDAGPSHRAFARRPDEFYDNDRECAGRDDDELRDTQPAPLVLQQAGNSSEHRAGRIDLGIGHRRVNANLLLWQCVRLFHT